MAIGMQAYACNLLNIPPVAGFACSGDTFVCAVPLYV